MTDAVFNKLPVLYNKAVLKHKIMFSALEFAFMKKAGPKQISSFAFLLQRKEQSSSFQLNKR